MKGRKANKVYLMKMFFVVLIPCFLHKNSFCQNSSRFNPSFYYHEMVDSLKNPDSLYVYEVNSTWGRGIAFFIYFKKTTTKCGYYLNKNFLSGTLLPRNLVSGTEKITDRMVILNRTVDSIEALKNAIESLHIFSLPEDQKFQNECGTSAITDGANYQLYKMGRGKNSFKSYYEIYSAKDCAFNKYYDGFIQLDHLFNQFFPSDKTIIKNLIEEYKPPIQLLK